MKKKTLEEKLKEKQLKIKKKYDLAIKKQKYKQDKKQLVEKVRRLEHCVMEMKSEINALKGVNTYKPAKTRKSKSCSNCGNYYIATYGFGCKEGFINCNFESKWKSKSNQYKMGDKCPKCENGYLNSPNSLKTGKCFNCRYG
jgi:hypothetical protein